MSQSGLVKLMLLLSLFWIFTFRLPWTDLFVEPAGS